MRLDSLRATLKEYQIGKSQGMIAYMDIGFKISLPSMIDRLSKWIDADKK